MIGTLKRFFARVGLFIAVFLGIALISAIAFTSETAGVMTLLGVFVSFLVAFFYPMGEKQSMSQKERGESASFTVTVSAVDPRGRHRSSNTVRVGDGSYSIRDRASRSKKVAQGRGRGDARLVPADATFEVRGFELKGPVYVGTPCDDGYRPDPAVINPRLKVVMGDVGEMGYWPNYSDLSPEQRYEYLEWLAMGRDDISNMGFVYLYFYGFERYVLRDACLDDPAVRDKNIRDIVAEIRRLRSLVGSQGNFDSYSNSLLDAIVILHRPANLNQRKSALPARGSLAVTMAIAKYANETPDELVDPEWALAWLVSEGSISRTKAFREQYPILRAFFSAMYLARGGVKAPTCKTKLKLRYSAASQGLEDVLDLPVPEGWCDPSQLARPRKKLQEIYDEVAKGVRAFARAREKGDRAAMLAAWPAGVSTEHQPQLHKFTQAIERVVSSEQSTLGTLGKLFWSTVPEKLTALQARQLARSVETAGYVMVPHPELTKVSLTKEHHLMTYPGQVPSELSPAAERVALSIHMGAILALADGEVHDNERATLRHIVDSHPNMEERQYLSLLAEWRLACPPSTTGLKKQIEALNPGQKGEMARHLVTMARADGNLPASEISMLEKLFKRLSLDTAEVTQMLHASAAPSAKAPEKSTDVQNEEVVDGGFQLDPAAIAAHAKATQEIHGVLGEIFSEQEADRSPDAEEPVAVVEEDESTDSSWHQGVLDAEHAALADWLLTGDSWPIDEISAKCQQMGLMPDGALEKINEAAFDTLGDALLELGDVVDVYHDMLTAEAGGQH